MISSASTYSYNEKSRLISSTTVTDDNPKLLTDIESSEDIKDIENDLDDGEDDGLDEDLVDTYSCNSSNDVNLLLDQVDEWNFPIFDLAEKCDGTILSHVGFE